MSEDKDAYYARSVAEQSAARTPWPHAGKRALGTNPRALGTNPRAVAKNRWALRNWKRAQRKGR